MRSLGIELQRARSRTRFPPGRCLSKSESDSCAPVAPGIDTTSTYMSHSTLYTQSIYRVAKSDLNITEACFATKN